MSPSIWSGSVRESGWASGAGGGAAIWARAIRPVLKEITSMAVKMDFGFIWFRRFYGVRERNCLREAVSKASRTPPTALMSSTPRSSVAFQDLPEVADLIKPAVVVSEQVVAG